MKIVIFYPQNTTTRLEIGILALNIAALPTNDIAVQLRVKKNIKPKNL